ncbi:MAG: cell division protein FtsZ, partial [Alphaproteobacteria bacterium]|nr:cell division protein FtsZ [Alphaproteobacteria bacterium]
RILVFGVGGAGGNAVNNMVSSRLEGVEFLVANTDAQALVHSKAHHRLQIGARLTQGLGAGSRPDIGMGAAEESADDIRKILESSHMVFITAGMGGGTGTGAAPVIAKLARDLGILTVGVVTKPFAFEGARRLRTAEEGIERLKPYVDTLIVIPNQNLFRIANEKTTFAKAFEMADEVLYAGVRGVTDLMVMPGLINLDFADVRTVIGEMGTSMMGMGEANGEGRATAAAEAAISNPLLDVSSMKGAKGVLINITGGMDLTLFEVDEAANKIRQEVDPEANIIVGSTFDERLNGRIRVSVVATGIASENRISSQPAKTLAAADAGKRTTPAPIPAAPIAETPRSVIAPSIIATAPAAAPVTPVDAGHPVHAMQGEIIRAGIAQNVGASSMDPTVCQPVQRGISEIDASAIDPVLAASIGSVIGDTRSADTSRRAAPVPASLQPEARKPSGFSVFGITIGGTNAARKAAGTAQPAVRTPAAPRAPSQARIVPASGRDGSITRDKPSDTLSGLSDEQLDIPAFLRRQSS